jgi:hypothetical protein
MEPPDASAGLLEDLGAVLALLDPVPAAVRRAAQTALHRPDEAESVIVALRYPPDRVVGMGYFPDELGLTSRELQGPQGHSKVAGP